MTGVILRLWPALLLGLLTVGVATAGMGGWAVWRAVADNRTIAALVDRHDVAVADDAPAELLFARTSFLVRHDRLDEAQALAGPVERAGNPAILAAFHYTLANARLRRAVELLESSRIDPAIPLVVLSKDGYRRALRIDPGLWNAKYNLDVAMRLIRDFPQAAGEEGTEEPPPNAGKLWTDLPGLPRGLP